MDKERFYQAIIAALLVVNLAILGVFLLNRPPAPKPEKLIVQGLQLDATQVTQFEALKLEHRGQVLELEAAYKAAATGYFESLRTAAGPQDTLLQKIAYLHSQKAQATYVHLQKIRELCTPEQKERYHSLLPEIIASLTQKNSPPPRRK